MKKKNFIGLALAAVMFISSFALSSCSADFWDGFVDGYNSTRYRSFDSGYIFDRIISE